MDEMRKCRVRAAEESAARRTREEKRMAVRMALNAHPEWSVRRVMRELQVSGCLVHAVLGELAGEAKGEKNENREKDDG